MTNLLLVLKSEVSNVRMVYKGTFIILNDILWETYFILLMLYIRMTVFQEDTYMKYIKIGEMFLDFMARENMRKFVD